MTSGMRWLLALACCVVTVRPAGGVKPCLYACHLEQGTPLYLPARGEVWVRVCRSDTCTFQRLAVADGAVRETRKDLDEYAFEDEHAGTRAIKLENTTPWKDLKKPLAIASDGVTPLTMKIAKRTLTCQRPRRVVTRSFACDHPTLEVRHAGLAPSATPADPSGLAAVVVTCGTSEQVLVCP